MYSAKIRYTANIVPRDHADCYDPRTDLANGQPHVENNQPVFVGTARMFLLFNHLVVLLKSFPVFNKLKEMARETGRKRITKYNFFRDSGIFKNYVVYWSPQQIRNYPHRYIVYWSMQLPNGTIYCGLHCLLLDFHAPALHR